MKRVKKLQLLGCILLFVLLAALTVGTFMGLCGSHNLPDWWLSACAVLRGVRVVPSLVMFALFMGTLFALAGVADACGVTGKSPQTGKDNS